MPIPQKIPILREEDYHTHYLGKYQNGNLFFGYDTFFFPPNYVLGADWQEHRRDYVVLFIFDSTGRFLEADYCYVGTPSENSDTNAKLAQMVNARGPYKFSAIEVELFQTEIDGEVFGLIVDEERETVELMSSRTITFSEPWDGEFYT